MIRHSATLAINERVSARREAGEEVVHLGFGEAGIPVLPEVVEVLNAAATRNSYGPVVGSVEARESAAGYFTRRGMQSSPEQIIFGPGSKALLYGVLASLDGDLVIPTPCWVTYAAQATLTGRHSIGVPAPAQAGGVPDPDLLQSYLDRARADGANPRIMIVTLPDNPTGTLASRELIRRVCAIAERNNMIIISDEIYRDLEYVPHAHLSPAEVLPERTVVSTGLSKSMALGGWRIGFARLPEGPFGTELMGRLVGVASEVWSSMATPMQSATAYILDEPECVLERVRDSRRLHQRVSEAAYQAFTEAGALCRRPTAAFYLYPDFEPIRTQLQASGITTGAQLCDRLLDHHGIGVLAGEHFGDQPAGLRFRVATSLLYGANHDQRLAALRSDDPASLPWIASALEMLRTGLHQVSEEPTATSAVAV